MKLSLIWLPEVGPAEVVDREPESIFGGTIERGLL